MSVSRVGNYLLKDVYCTLFVMDLNYIHELLRFQLLIWNWSQNIVDYVNLIDF